MKSSISTCDNFSVLFSKCLCSFYHTLHKIWALYLYYIIAAKRHITDQSWDKSQRKHFLDDTIIRVNAISVYHVYLRGKSSLWEGFTIHYNLWGKVHLPSFRHMSSQKWQSQVNFIQCFIMSYSNWVNREQEKQWNLDPRKGSWKTSVIHFSHWTMNGLPVEYTNLKWSNLGLFGI